MRKLTWTILLAVTLCPSPLQLLAQESFRGAALGGLIGGIIGHNQGRRTREGIAIGAGAGFLLRSLADQSRGREYYAAPPAVYPNCGYAYYRPNYAVSGAVLGGLAGGIRGHNQGRRTAEGAAIGAGAGMVLGAMAEQQARRTHVIVQPAPLYAGTPTAVGPTESNPSQAPPPARTLATSIASSSPMSSANSLFGR